MTMRRLGWSGSFLLTAALGACSVFGSDDPPGSPPPQGDAGPDVGALNEPRSLEVTVPPIVAMEGQTTSVEVSLVRRGGLDADVTLAVEGLPTEIQTAPVTIPKGETSAKVDFAVKAAAKHGARTGIVVRATSEEVRSEAPVVFSVRGKAGSFDTSFGTGGSTGDLMNGLGGPSLPDEMKVVALPDGKVALLATVRNVTGDQFFASRVDEGGILDKTFAGIGSTRFGGKDNLFRGGTVQPDGKLIACGHQRISGKGGGVVARLTVEGNPDSAFGTVGEFVYDHAGAGAAFYDCTMTPSGRIGLSGIANSSELLFAQLTPTGALATDWGEPAGIKIAGYARTPRLAVVPDGRYLGALSTGATPAIQALLAHGRAVDLSFGPEGRLLAPGDVKSFQPARLIVRADGRIVFGIAPTTGTDATNLQVDGFEIVQYLASAQVDTSFGKNGVVDLFRGTPSSLRDIAVEADGKVVMVGYYRADGKDGSAIVRVDASGKLDASFGVNGVIYSASERFTALAIDGAGRIIVGYYSLSALGGYEILRLWN